MHTLLLADAASSGPEGLGAMAIAFVTLTAMEIVLGIDNVVFIAILAGRLPEHQRAGARRLGLMLALVTRIAFLATIKFIIDAATANLFRIPFLDHDFTGKDLVLLVGGLFLIWKATHEIHGKFEGEHAASEAKPAVRSFGGVIAQIVLIDIVFSIDSVVTAVGMARNIWVMVAAVVVSVVVMLAAAGPIAGFVERHPTLKMLALSFLLLIGVMLVADSAGQHIPKGYIYFAMAFSLGVEILNIKTRAKGTGATIRIEARADGE